jgi:hypothetical protein
MFKIQKDKKEKREKKKRKSEGLEEKSMKIGTKLVLIAYFGNIRTLISETSGQHNGNIRTAFRKHSDTLS